jgi:hypothetical protein
MLGSHLGSFRDACLGFRTCQSLAFHPTSPACDRPPKLQRSRSAVAGDAPDTTQLRPYRHTFIHSFIHFLLKQLCYPSSPCRLLTVSSFCSHWSLPQRRSRLRSRIAAISIQITGQTRDRGERDRERERAREREREREREKEWVKNVPSSVVCRLPSLHYVATFFSAQLTPVFLPASFFSFSVFQFSRWCLHWYMVVDCSPVVCFSLLQFHRCS